MNRIEAFIKSQGEYYEKRLANNTVTIYLENFKEKQLEYDEFFELIENIYGECAYNDGDYIMFAYEKAVIFETSREMIKSIEEFKMSISELINHQMKVTVRLSNTGEHLG